MIRGARSSARIERRPSEPEVPGSNPGGPANEHFLINDIPMEEYTRFGRPLEPSRSFFTPDNHDI